MCRRAVAGAGVAIAAAGRSQRRRPAAGRRAVAGAACQAHLRCSAGAGHDRALRRWPEGPDSLWCDLLSARNARVQECPKQATSLWQGRLEPEASSDPPRESAAPHHGPFAAAPRPLQVLPSTPTLQRLRDGRPCREGVVHGCFAAMDDFWLADPDTGELFEVPGQSCANTSFQLASDAGTKARSRPEGGTGAASLSFSVAAGPGR